MAKCPPCTYWPNVRWPSVRWPNVRWPSVRWPNVRWPSVRWPNVRWPSVRWPNVRWPSVRWPSVRWPSVRWPNGRCPSVWIPLAIGHDLIWITTPELSPLFCSYQKTITNFQNHQESTSVDFHQIRCVFRLYWSEFYFHQLWQLITTWRPPSTTPMGVRAVFSQCNSRGSPESSSVWNSRLYVPTKAA